MVNKEKKKHEINADTRPIESKVASVIVATPTPMMIGMRLRYT